MLDLTLTDQLLEGGVMEKTGSCLCGKTKYSLQGVAVGEFICHCADCKKQTASPFSVVAGFVADNFQWISNKYVKEHVTLGDSGGKVKRFFCGNCGSPLYSDADVTPGVYWIKIGTLDDPSWVQPGMEVYAKDKIKCGQSGLELESHDTLPANM